MISFDAEDLDMLRFCICIGMALLFAPSQALAAVGRLFNEDGVATLMGILEIQAFPGPPNYESVVQGDTLERSLFIRLGLVGTAGGFAVFPGYETGHTALVDLLKNEMGKLSLEGG